MTEATGRGLGQRTLGQNPTPYEQQVAADLDHLGLQVTPQNVLQIRNIVLGAAQRLHDALYREARNITVGPPGGDPISKLAADVLTDKSHALVAECRTHADAYRTAGENLGHIARAYGHTEQAISDSFTAFVKANQDSWGLRLQQDEAVAGLPGFFRDVAAPPSPSRPAPRSWEDLLTGGLS